MQKFTSIFLYVLTGTVIVSGIGLSSCSKDGDKKEEAKPQLSFASATQTVNEADGLIEVEMVLDKAASETIIVEYELAGTAQDKATATNTSPADYEIPQDHGELTIKKGETSGVIEIQLYSDFGVEDGKPATEDVIDPETIEISITNVDSENIEVTGDDKTVISVEQEDGLAVLLDWGVGEGENYTDVDMDLFLWVENDAGTDLVLSNLRSVAISFETGEGFFLPTAVLDDGTYGLSANYYEGTAEPMNFVVRYISLIDSEVDESTTRNGTYTLANINKWDATLPTTNLKTELTFEKSGAAFSDFSQITVPTTGSRVRSSELPPGKMRGDAN